MADPISISASIAGLVTLADVVFSRTYKYVRAAKKASSEISGLSSELGALYGVLCSVRSISMQLQAEAFESTARVYEIYSCQKTLEIVSKILDRDRCSASLDEPWETIKRKLHWPFKASEVKSLMSGIERHKTTLGLALQADGAAGLLKVLSGQKEISASIEDIKSELRLKREIDVRVMLNKERHNILRTFGDIDPRRSHDMSRRLRHPGTGVWLTESPTFQHWLCSTNEYLWLYGIPGAGKTVLASLAIDETLQKCTPNHAVAYFYCDYKDRTTQEAHRILGSLAQQIAKQDEQSFEKLRRFYEAHGQGRKDPVAYDSKLLRDLLKDLISNYERTSIIIDALDECMKNVTDVLELLTSLSDDTDDVNVNLLILSRDEFEIRGFLDAKPQISIAAENSDLRLYVGAEIEERITKKKLKIKSPSLKEHIVERLIDGADGMFRWVTCQIDYLCELPNDASRRKALNNLPQGLTPTYERILRKINGCDAEVQKLAQRTFHWLYCESGSLSTSQLCQAVAIEFGDVWIDDEAVPDESDILRHCGSLIRKSANGRQIEFAHFTVKEFLSQLDDTKSNEFAPYVMDPDVIRNGLAKVCLTYMTMRNFERYKNVSKDNLLFEWDEHSFLSYANRHWDELVRNWHDIELVKLLKRLFHPSKNGTLVSWAEQWFFQDESENLIGDTTLIQAGIKEGTALHYAAMLCIPEVCEWLIEEGCDVNRWSAFGTPLQCAIVTLQGCRYRCYTGDQNFEYAFDPLDRGRRLATVDVLLAAGSSPNPIDSVGIESGYLSTLVLALQTWDPLELTLRLLMKGACFDEYDIEAICNKFENEEELQQIEKCFLSLAQRLCEDSTEDVTQEIILKRALITMGTGKTRNQKTLLPKKVSVKVPTDMEKAELEKSMRTAAEYGQLELMIQFLDQYGIFVDAACSSTGKTALHLAAANDHLDIIKTLIERGANTAAKDFTGRTTLHFSIRRSGCSCLRFLLEQDNNVNLLENNGGCSVHDIDADGLSPLHYAVNACSLECIQLLVEYGSDVFSVTQDGSSPLHLAMMPIGMERQEVMKFLISKGSSPFRARDDGITPIDILISEHPAEPNIQTTQNILQMLVKWRNPNLSVELDLSQNLLRLCQLDLTDRPLWLSIALKTLLQNGADFTNENEAGETAFSVLLCSWLRTFSVRSNKDITTLQWVYNSATNLVHTALNHVPADTLSNPHYDLSSLLLSALRVGDELLARKILDFSPDVDHISSCGGQKLSAVEAASLWNCSDTLFKIILDRSKASSNSVLASRIFAQIVDNNLMDRANVLFEAGLDPNSCSERGVTPLMLASSKGHVDMMAWLIKHGSNVKSADQDGWSAAHHACLSGSLEVIRVLQTTDIDWHAKVHAKFNDLICDEVALLHIAAFHAESALLKYLIDEYLARDLNCITSSGHTPLHLAVGVHNTDTVALLLSKNVKTNVMCLGESPLHLCVRFGFQILYSLLKSQDHDLRTPNKQGLNCEMIAWKHGHKELAKEIALDIAGMQNIALVSPVPPLVQSLQALKLAIELDDLQLCEKAIAEGASPESRLPYCNNNTALSYCVQINRPKIAEFLVSKGVSSVSVAHGFTLFHFAVQWNYIELLKVLLQKHSSELLQNLSPLHPMHIAILVSAKECVKLMLNHRFRGSASVLDSASTLHKSANYTESLPLCNAPTTCAEHAINFLANVSTKESLDPQWERNPVGGHFIGFVASCTPSSTPLHLAALVGDRDSANVLLAAGSRLDAVDSRYDTALHIAARNIDCSITEILLDSGASIFTRNICLETPPMVAATRGHLRNLQALSRKGVDFEARNFWDETILHLAAKSGSIGSFAHILNTIQDFDLETECRQGFSVLELAFSCSRNGMSFLLNLKLSSHPNTSHQINVLTAAVLNPSITIQHLKMLLKRLPPELFISVLNNRAKHGGTPLYAGCVAITPHREIEIINLLLDAGASIDKDGGPYGSPLMAACTMGRLFVVKLLISRGAQTTFIRGHQTTNVLHAARNFPDIIHWLLVGRFTEGPRLLTLGLGVK